jgi:transposase
MTMAREHIPGDVQRFILTSIPSVPFLEAMLLLRSGADTDRSYDARQLAQGLYMSEKAAHALLVELHEAGILVADVGDDAENVRYRYQPASDDLDGMITRLADAYAKNLVEIANLIHSKVGKKAQQFADAFLFRKDG